MPGTAVRSVVVAGGGIVGWSAAAALKRHLPALSVTVVPVPPPPDALADRIGSTLPSILEFHRDLRLGETDTVLGAASGFRLGTRFEAWSEGLPDYVHAYGECGRPIGSVPFHQHWLRGAKTAKVAPFPEYSPAAVMGEHGRFVHPTGDPAFPLSTFGYGLELDPVRYQAMMRAFARHLGVVERQGDIAAVRLRGKDGFIDALALHNGAELKGDLFVDATGPAALLRGRLDEAWDDWSNLLACDRLIFAETSAPAAIPPLGRAVAFAEGWRWQSASPSRSSHGLVYSSRHLSELEAGRVLRDAAGAEPQEPAVTIRQGRRPQPWLRNCLAIGDAAVAVEPLEWTNLHLAHDAIDRMISMMPDRDCSAVELWDFNRQTAAEADRVRDFLVLHYAIAHRPSDPFWREGAARPLPDSLAHTLAQFRERGRLPFYEEETFARDSWLAVLFGQGVVPRRINPLIDPIPPAESDRALAQMRASLQTLVQSLPSHADYLRNLSRQAAR